MSNFWSWILKIIFALKIQMLKCISFCLTLRLTNSTLGACDTKIANAYIYNLKIGDPES